MNQDDVTVTFYLKKNELDNAGRCSVMGRLTIGRSESVFSAKMLAPLSLWTSGRAKGKSAEAVEINRRLDELRASAISIYREQSAVRERVTAEEVKCLLLGMAFGQKTLLGYFRSHIEYFEKRIGVNRTAKSAHTYHCAREHVERFLSERLRLSDIPFSALDRSFIDKFDLYLRTERELAPNTISRIVAMSVCEPTKPSPQASSQPTRSQGTNLRVPNVNGATSRARSCSG